MGKVSEKNVSSNERQCPTIRIQQVIGRERELCVRVKVGEREEERRRKEEMGEERRGQGEIKGMKREGSKRREKGKRMGETICFLRAKGYTSRGLANCCQKTIPAYFTISPQQDPGTFLRCKLVSIQSVNREWNQYARHFHLHQASNETIS